MESGEASAVDPSEREPASKGPLWLAWIILGIAGVLAALVAIGGRPANPLDWKVKAGTPQAFVEWNDNTAELLPADVARELNSAFAFISSRTPGAWPVRSGDRNYANDENPFCRQINRRTVREVIIDGYSAVNAMLLQRIVTNSDQLLDSLSRQSDPANPPVEQSKVDAAVAARQKTIDAYKAQIEVNNQRIAELQRPRAGSR